nr:AAA family ATPase [Treponema sp.]
VSIHVEDSVLSYIVELAEKTRNDSRLAAGVSTRGTIALYKACQAYAAISGRDFVTPEDVKELAENVFVNRVILSSESVLKGFTAQSIISDILMQVPIPEFSAHV